MRASVQYNDYVGTSAADISDFNKLTDCLKERGVDTERFNPIGVTIYSGESGNIYFSIVCEDRANGNKLGKISIRNISIQEIQSLFKRMEIVLTTHKHLDSEWNDAPIMTIE